MPCTCKEASLCYTAASVADIDYSPERELDRRKVNELAECGYLLSGRNIILMGATGVGKTYLACALSAAACRHSYTCRYIRMPNLLDELALAKDSGSFAKVIHQYSKASLLIVDEWLLNPSTEEKVANIFELIEARASQGRSILFCTRTDVSEWLSLLGNSLLAESIMDRIIHNSSKIIMKGDSMRKQIASRKQN